MNLLKLSEVAEVLNVSERTVDRLVKSGALPTVRPSRETVRVLGEDLLLFVQARQRAEGRRA